MNIDAANPWENRHPSVKHFEPLFEFSHLSEGLLRDTSRVFAQMARTMLTLVEDGPEMSAGLRKLLEAKDCFVRQAVLDRAAAIARVKDDT
jgi:hypothetical protein